MKTIYYFTADWCAPCKKTRPIVEELNHELPDAKFQIIDSDSEIDMVKAFNIKSIPTFILMENGNEIARISGAQNKEDLKGFIYGK